MIVNKRDDSPSYIVFQLTLGLADNGVVYQEWLYNWL